MFVNVKAFVFYACLHAQAGEFLYTEEEQESANRSPEVDYQDAKALYAKEMQSAAVEEAAVCCQEPCHQRSKYSAYTVY